MLRLIQQDLERVYDIDSTIEIDDFVCDEMTARAVVGNAVERGEVVWIRENAQEIALGLYVAPRAIQVLLQAESRTQWYSHTFWAWSLATEGVSHLIYLHHKACLSQTVSLLELELQAEIDKYVTGLMLLPEGADLIEHSATLRRELFEKVQYLDAPESEAGDRYRQANRLAAIYARMLEQEFLKYRAMHAFAASLRRFYRLGGMAKLRYCRTG